MLASVFVLALILVLILILILVVVLVLAVVLVLVAVFILIVHNMNLLNDFARMLADIGCPYFQDLSFPLKIRLANNPAKIAAVIPPAVDLRPPVNTPMNP